MKPKNKRKEKKNKREGEKKKKREEEENKKRDEEEREKREAKEKKKKGEAMWEDLPLESSDQVKILSVDTNNKPTLSRMPWWPWVGESRRRRWT